MKRLLTETERKLVRKALWEDCKRLPLPRKARLSFMESLYLEWLDKFNARQEEESAPEQRIITP